MTTEMARDWTKLQLQHHQGYNDMYKPPSGHDKHLADHERAHSGEPGAKVRHGADATQTRYPKRPIGDPLNDIKEMNNPDFVDLSGPMKHPITGKHD